MTYQLMKVEQPVENVAAWLFRAARNEMTDRARKKREVSLSGYVYGRRRRGFPGRRAGRNPVRRPAHAGGRSISKRCCGKSWGRRCLNCQRRRGRVFEKTELHGYSIKMLAEESGASEQALLSRKHKAVLFLRTRLRDVYDALTGV
ncbi:RNA Polymerase Sigma-24 Subunit ECF Subfamily protein [Enterobacter asburiae]|uniref:RNA Polymerase Sigma-24 Subunit ECF Subfamily protein n=1 Tax=Enterobacter asburiae TaxID=61645 RepID=A0A376FD49_ENTAS|nr:RNA Polymerase Sigma-24 Subunit ECF Subfamily protein [Enterobacter asburiae]